MELSSRNSLASNTLESDDGVPLETQRSRAQYALPPTDQGFYAWVALGGAFLSNALIWGFALSFGILQEYYTSHEPFASQGGIAAIGTTSTGIMYLTMPLFLWGFQRWPKARRWSLWVSVPIIATSLIGASFSNTVPQLIVCQGIVYGIAGNALVMPTINLINEWFLQKRGLAIGIAISGDFAGGVAMPLILQAVLNEVGFRWTLRIVALIIVILASPILFLMKPRLPILNTHISPPVDLAFLKSPFFWTLQFFNTIQALGYFLPTNYLPTIAESLGLGRTLGSLTILCVNLAGIFGCIGVGALVDRFDVTLVLLGQGLFSCIAVFIILGFTTSIAPLFVFSLVYGLTAAAYSTSWGGVIRELQRKHENTDANVVFGLLAMGRGVGSVISGPLSETLLDESTAPSVRGSILNLNPSMHHHWPKDLYSGLTTDNASTTGKESSRPAIGEPRVTMNRPELHQRPGDDYRQLRMVTILAFLLAVSLLLPHGVSTERALPAIGIAPMFFSALTGILIFTGMLRSPRTKALMDLGLAAFLFSIMVPSFVSLRNNGWYHDAGVTMLGTYGTSTMILNFAIHSYLGAISRDYIEFPRLVIAWRSSPCSHCDHHHHSVSLPGGPMGLNGPGSGLPHEQSAHGVHQPFIDSSDEAARDSSDYQTSGFGSPRRSAETLATDANDFDRRAGSFEC